MVSFDHEQVTQFAFDIFVFLLFLLITAVLAAVTRLLIDRAIRSSSQFPAGRIKWYATLLIWAVGIILAFSQMGISTDLLTLLLALAGIALLLSAYPILQNIISRTFFNVQYKIEDKISIGGYQGKVVDITDINTVLLDDSGDLISVPNAMFLKEIWTKHQISGYEFNVPVVIKKDIDVVDFEKALHKSLQEFNNYFKKAPAIVTTRAGEKTTELSLILTLKDPAKKSLLTTEIHVLINNLIAEFTEKAINSQKESKLKEIKDIGT